MNTKKGYFISTAIAYPNSRMHVGFGWEVIGADVLARFQRMQGRPVFFSTGTDEHSQNVEKAALAKEMTPKVYCDQMADEIRESMDRMDISYDRFIRTSDADHENVCKYLIEKAFKKGDVYKKKYEGLYCEGCEVFYTEKETIELDGKPSCPTHKQSLKILSEENYFFKLSSYEDKIKELLRRKEPFLSPDYRRNEVLSFVEQGLKDFSVSRTSFKWGISLPFDPEHIIYVWYDALINYLSAVKYPIKDESGKCIQGDEQFFNQFWPCDVHVIGKDITRFHSVYWPAMLMSAGVELPQTVWAHGFINLNGEKMSKTRGNIVTPDEVMADFGATALRWYLIAANPFDGDGNYSDQDLILKCNADLSNNIGNLVNRTLSMAAKYFSGQTLKSNAVLPEGIESLKSRYERILGVNAVRLKETIEKENDLMKYASLCIEFSMALNKMIDETKPWALAKAQNLDVLETVLFELFEGIRILGISLWPIIPQASQAILNQLGLSSDDKTKGVFWVNVQTQSNKTLTVPLWSSLESFISETSSKVRPPQPLFVRLEQKLEKTL